MYAAAPFPVAPQRAAVRPSDSAHPSVGEVLTLTRQRIEVNNLCWYLTETTGLNFPSVRVHFGAFAR